MNRAASRPPSGAPPKLALFERFADPTLERRYRREQRTRQARFSLIMVYIAGGSILLYWTVNLLVLDLASTLTIIAQQSTFVPVLLAYAWMLRQPFYADAWWADILLFVAVQPGLLLSIDAIIATGAPGWTFNAQLCYGLQTAMAFACLAFAAAVRPLFFLTLASIAYLAITLVVRGYPQDAIIYTTQNYALFAIVLFFVNWASDRKGRALFVTRIRLDEERAQSERLLRNMLPEPVAERLKSQQAIADDFGEIVVVFVDLVGFTTLSQRLGARRIVELLNDFFERADRGTDLFGLEKVKTIGDAYMAVAGAITKPPRPAKAAVDFAVYLRDAALEAGRPFGVDLRLHVGIASGPAIGGVISAKRLSYDYWGPTINLAARLQDSAAADGIAVSEPVYRAVADSYPFHPPRTVTLKGLGDTAVYDLALGTQTLRAG